MKAVSIIPLNITRDVSKNFATQKFFMRRFNRKYFYNI